MKGSKLSGTLECWRGTGEDEMPVEVSVSLHVWAAPPNEGRGYEVDVMEATADGQPFQLTDAEVDRAIALFAECEP